jgi:hypothetical protein
MYSCPKHHVFNNKKGNDNKIKVNYSFDTLTNVPLAFARATMLVYLKADRKFNSVAYAPFTKRHIKK